MSSLIRITAFFQKEIFEILRQPRLILSLILGPFLILLLFGVGYRNEAQTVRTLFVAQVDSPFRGYLEEYVSDVSRLVEYAGIIENEELALQRLRQNQVDAVIVLPDKPIETIRGGNQAVFNFYHNEIDPFFVDYMSIFSRIYVDAINERLLIVAAQEGQASGALLQSPLEGAKESTTAFKASLEAGDTVTAQAHQIAMARSVGLLAVTAGNDETFLTGVGQQFGEENEPTLLGERILRLQQNTAALSNIEPDKEDYSAEIATVSEIEKDLDEMESVIGDVREINPRVLVRPFYREIESINQASSGLSDFYVPAVIALLIQHLAITFAALSIVRERNSGVVELFRVSPINSWETLLGKYASYSLFIGLLALVLTLLIRYGLGIPMLGSWGHYIAVLAVLIFTSLGIGFTISLIAKTTTQAVQYAMILLLASIFFSGFFLGLRLLWAPVQIVSWLIPATYAIELLRNIMLRGAFDTSFLLPSMLLIGLTFFASSWMLLRRMLSHT